MLKAEVMNAWQLSINDQKKIYWKHNNTYRLEWIGKNPLENGFFNTF